MAKSYSDCFEELKTESRERIEGNPHINWEEAVREAVEDAVFRTYTQQTLENILDESRANDEWQIYCSDMSDYEQVREAMAYTAIRIDVVQALEDDYE